MTAKTPQEERAAALLDTISAHRARQRERMIRGEHHSDGSALTRANRELLKTAAPRKTAPGDHIESFPLVGAYLTAFKPGI